MAVKNFFSALAVSFLLSTTALAQVPYSLTGCVPIAYYGGFPTAADNTAAWNRAKAVTNPANPCIQFGLGVYSFASPISYTMPSGDPQASLSIIGAGQDGTILSWASGSGLTVTKYGDNTSIHIRDLTIQTGAASQATTGLTLLDAVTTDANPGAGAASDISHVTFDGSGGANSGTDWWGTSVAITSVSNVTFFKDYFQSGATYQNTISTAGTGITLAGTSSYFGVIYNVIGTEFNSPVYAIQIGNDIQGLTVTGGSNVVGGYVGLYVPSSTTTGVNQISLADSSTQSGLYGVWINGTGVNQLNVHHNTILTNTSSYGVEIDTNVNNFLIEGNAFYGVGSHTGEGINITGTTQGLVVGNVFSNLTAPYTFANGNNVAYSDQFIGNTSGFTCNTNRCESAAYFQGSANENPTGTGSGSAAMMGLGTATYGTATITPVSSGNFQVTISGTVQNGTINDGGTIQIYVGSGTAPANGTAQSNGCAGSTPCGTAVGAPVTFLVAAAAQKLPFSVTGVYSGATLGTAYWMDAGVNASVGGAVTLTNVRVIAVEQP